MKLKKKDRFLKYFFLMCCNLLTAVVASMISIVREKDNKINQMQP